MNQKHKKTFKELSNKTTKKGKLIIIPSSSSSLPITFGNHSFSPSINQKLIPKTNTSPQNMRLLTCVDFNDDFRKKLPDIFINNSCITYETKEAQEQLLRHLAASSRKSLSWQNIIAPRQLKSNCWFNTMFMCFFVSNKGRKFFKFFRQLMIQGTTAGRASDGREIKPPRLRNSFAYLNLAIEACLMGDNKASALDTNKIIQSIYRSIPVKFRDLRIKPINKPGNPIDYYSAIMNYLQPSKINIIDQTVNKDTNIQETLLRVKYSNSF